MSESLPVSLIIAWVVFFGFLNTHQRHIKGFRGDSKGFLFLLDASMILGSLAGLALIVYYFLQVAWYWPVILFVVGSLVSGFLFGILDAKIGAFYVSLVGFIGWPVGAIWAYFIIRDLRP